MNDGVSLIGVGAAVTILDALTSDPLLKSSVIVCENLADLSTTISGFTITNGSAVYGNSNGIYRGGGIYALNSILTITNNVIINNHAYRGGGGIYAEFDRYNTPASASLIISNNTVKDNSTDRGLGGGICVYDDNGNILTSVTMDNNLVDHNTSNSDAGGIYVGVDNSKLTVKNNTIINNDSSFGGGLYFDAYGGDEEEFVLIENNTISYNNADGDGGGIYSCCYPASTHIIGNTVSYNTADSYGGGITLCCSSAWDVESDIRLTDNIISHNEAEYCGGICIQDSSLPHYIEGNEITDNRAGDLGGGICLHGGVGYVRNNLIARNHSDNRGGGIFVERNLSDTYPLIISGNQILDNESDVGGGIALDVGSWVGCIPAEISHNTIAGNSADIAGGIYLYSDTAAKIIANIISNNTAVDGGGGIYSEIDNPDSLDVVNNMITGNTATKGSGGGIACVGSLTYPATGNIINNTIAGNSGKNGGGIFAEDATITVTNCILWDNLATAQHGGKNDLAGCSATYSDIEDGDAGVGNISCDPQFVNPGAEDYHLSSASCAIDVGTTLPEVTDDIDGDTRPQDIEYDMGADEYVAI